VSGLLPRANNLKRGFSGVCLHVESLVTTGMTGISGTTDLGAPFWGHSNKEPVPGFGNPPPCL